MFIGSIYSYFNTQMKYLLQDYFLEFKTPFSIAHGTRNGTDIVLLKLEFEGCTGNGEASLPPYLKETKESVKLFINDFFLNHPDFSIDLEILLSTLENFREENFAAKACIDIALHNWHAAKNKIALWQLLGLKNSPLPDCTFTIGMGSRSEINLKIQEAADFNILKVKLGGNHDKDIIAWIRDLTDKHICVDVNQGWKDKEVALEMIQWLHEKNVLFVEQPLPKLNSEDMAWLYEKSPLPIYADEAVQVADDVIKVKDFYDGINIKLMKCGGISGAIKMIAEARKFGLKVLIGSMSETGCGINAAAQLTSLADYADLDGPLLTKNNPFNIVKYENGKVLLQ